MKAPRPLFVEAGVIGVDILDMKAALSYADALLDINGTVRQT